MEVRITGRHAALGEDVKKYVHEKLGPISRYWDRTRSLEVVLDEVQRGWNVEVIAHIARGSPIVATIAHKDPRAAIDLAHDKIERLLTKEKEKRRSKRKDNGMPATSRDGRAKPSTEEE